MTADVITTLRTQDRSICVIGLGYVGLPTACLLTRAGHVVHGVDIDSDLVSQLNNGGVDSPEVDLDALISQSLAQSLTVSEKPTQADVFMICVPTPVTVHRAADLRAITAAVDSIVPVLERGNLVIIESTCPVGTTRNLVAERLAANGLRHGEDFDLCYCPERVLPGNSIQELTGNSRAIGGTTPAAALRAAEVYRSFCHGELRCTTDLAAEMCKLMENSYRDVNIAIANTFACIAEDAGVDVREAIELANMHPRVDILSPGPGVGGHCIPVDPWFLIEGFPEVTEVLLAARQRNDAQGERLFASLQEHADLQPGQSLAILGAAYKGDIDDPRESPTWQVVAAARAAGLTVHVHDPLVGLCSVHGEQVHEALDAVLRNADAAMIMTDHSEYRILPADIFASLMRGCWVADGRSVLDAAAVADTGVNVLVLGGPTALSSTPQVVAARA